MAYVADPTNSAKPADGDDASGGAAEFRALKAYLQTLLNNGSSIPVTGYAWQGFRNKIINGNFDEWIRGTSLGAATGTRYLCDRWNTTGIGSTVAPSQQAFVLGQTVVPYEPRFFHRCVVASVAGAGNCVNFVQPIENVRTLAGRTGILSFWAKADAAKNIAIDFIQSFGTGGAPSALINGIGSSTKTLGTGFQFFTVPVTLPSISGKTLGSNNDDYLGIRFWFDAGSNFNAFTNSLGQQSGTFDIAQVQFEPDSSATPFELLPIEINRARCARYARTMGVIVGQCFTTTVASAWHNIGLPMRAVPTLSTSAGWAVATAGGGSAGGTVVVGVVANNDLATIRFDVSGAVGLVAGNATVFTPPAGAYITAEL